MRLLFNHLPVPLDRDAPLDGLGGGTAFLVDFDRTQGLLALSLGNLHVVVDLDPRDERLAIRVLDEALDLRGQSVRLSWDLPCPYGPG